MTASPTPPRPADSPGFSVLYADPPWRLKGGARMPYPMMSTRDICALPVRNLCAPDCLLFLWAVPAHLPDALAVVRAWGFDYRTVAFTWVKRTPRDTGFLTGRGYWTRSNAEPCLLAARGRPARAGTDVSSLIVSPRREHSRKPDEARERIVRIAGDVPRAELFARQKVPGWSAWGNEVACDFSLAPEFSPAPRSTSADNPPDGLPPADAPAHRALPPVPPRPMLPGEERPRPHAYGKSSSSPALSQPAVSRNGEDGLRKG